MFSFNNLIIDDILNHVNKHSQWWKMIFLSKVIENVS